jgi:hypothetical protein
MICVYCLKNKPLNCFVKSEHVIPQSLGNFNNNLVLNTTLKNKAVCDNCNQYFGDNIEFDLGRDTIEGIFRYHLGVKKSKDFKPPRNKRTTIKIIEGEMKGAYASCKFDKLGNFGVDLISQISLKNKNTGENVYFRLNEIKTRAEFEADGFVVKGENAITIIPKNNDELNQIRKLLESKGFKLEGEYKFYPFSEKDKATVKGEFTSIVDKIIFRSIAKIAFNYLTYNHGVDFALNKNFNDVRNFIKNGEDTGVQYVYMNNKPVIENENLSGAKITLGHILTIDWEKSDIVSMVSLFNTFRYKVILSSNFKGIYRPIAKGHHFNIKTKKVKELIRIPKWIVLPRFRRIIY